jgi:hypothetical protein
LIENISLVEYKIVIVRLTVLSFEKEEDGTHTLISKFGFGITESTKQEFER